MLLLRNHTNLIKFSWELGITFSFLFNYLICLFITQTPRKHMKYLKKILKIIGDDKYTLVKKIMVRTYALHILYFDCSYALVHGYENI